MEPTTTTTVVGSTPFPGPTTTNWENPVTTLDTQRNDEVETARDLRDAAQWEIGQTRTSQNTLLTAISLLGTSLGLVGTWATNRPNIGGGNIGPILIEAATYVFTFAFLAILVSIHPRGMGRKRLKTGTGVTGWPVLLQFDRDDDLTTWLHHASADRAGHTIRDARTKARIATKKHRWLRLVVRLIALGFVLAVVGVRLWLLGI